MMNKKMTVLRMLQVLQEHSDDNHPLSQREIIDYLKTQYDIIVDRKTVKRYLLELEEEFPIHHGSKIERSFIDPKTGEKVDNDILTEYYYLPEFTEGELRLLIDGVLCSRYIHAAHREDLINKLEGMASKYFKSRTGHIQTLVDPVERNQDIFWIIEDIDSAINSSTKVTFQYLEYGTDKQLHAKIDWNGNPRIYVVNPVQIVMANGLYYLIGNVDWHDNLSSFRLDKIKDLTVLNEPAKPNSKIKGAEQVINPAKYPQDHIYMYSTEPVVVRFRAKKQILDEIMDRFGNSATFSNETETDVEVRVVTDPSAMRYWALQYATNVRILFPPTLVEQVKGSLLEALDSYS